MNTTTIRVSMRTHELLRELANQDGVSMQSLLERALEQYRRQQLLEATNAAYATLLMNPVAVADMEQEDRAWDQTLTDGLEES